MRESSNIFTFEWHTEVSNEERDRLFAKVLWAIDRWKLHVPAVLILETTAPLSFLASQAMIVFAPFLAALFPNGMQDVQKCVKILDNPKNMRILIDQIIESETNGTRK